MLVMTVGRLRIELLRCLLDRLVNGVAHPLIGLKIYLKLISADMPQNNDFDRLIIQRSYGYRGCDRYFRKW